MKILLAVPVACLLVVAIPHLLVWFLLALLWSFARSMCLRNRFERVHGSQGQRIVLVYSESPHWQKYIEEHWLPKLDDVAVCLNWSLRNEWKTHPTLASKVFEHWSGRMEFNPMAIYLPRRGRVVVVRFWQAFKDHKHGNAELLREREAELFEIADAIRANVSVTCNSMAEGKPDLSVGMKLFLVPYIALGVMLCGALFGSDGVQFDQLAWMLVFGLLAIGFARRGYLDAVERARKNETYLGFTPEMWKIAPAGAFLAGFGIGVYLCQQGLL